MVPSSTLGLVPFNVSDSIAAICSGVIMKLNSHQQQQAALSEGLVINSARGSG
jgi:hypothetical protein